MQLNDIINRMGCRLFLLPIFIFLSNQSINAQSYAVASFPDSSELICPGDTAYYNIDFQALMPSPGTASFFSISGLPTGAMASFSQSSISSSTVLEVEIASDTVSPGVYNVTFESLNINGEFYSVPLVFEIDSPPPPMPPAPSTMMLQPSNGATAVPMPVDFEWSNAGAGYYYHFVVASDTSFNTIIDSITTLDTAYTSTQMMQNTSYYWRVSVIDTAWYNAHGGTTCGQGIIGALSPNYFSFQTENQCSTFIVDAFVISDYNGEHISCAGAADGELLAFASGGATPYTYFWPIFGQNTDFISGVPAGIYDVIVTDANGCQEVATVFAIDPVPVTSTIASTTNVSCNSSCDGTATIAASGGVAPYTYQWDVNASAQTTATAVNLCAGTYAVTTTDMNGCSIVEAVTISEPAPLNSTIIYIIDNPCLGQCSGEALVEGQGGTAPYTYSWSNGQSTALGTGLCAGSYTVTITDANGCFNIINVLINEPISTLVTTVTNITHPLCSGDCTGEATIMAVGGTPPYTYQWVSGGQTTATVTGLCSGIYDVIIYDANGCSVVETITINDGVLITPSITNITEPSCFGLCDGEVTVDIAGGSAPYTYAWSDGQITNSGSITGLCAGNYSVTVTDNNGCVGSISFTITEPQELVVSLLDSIEPSCTNCLDGSLSIDVMGGTAPYTYLWNNGGTNDQIDSLDQGNYSVLVTDANGCSTELFTTLSVALFTHQVDEEEAFQVFPNPNNGQFQIILEAGHLDEGILSIQNALGQSFYNQPINNNQIFTIEGRDWSSGMYIISLYIPTQNRSIVQKVIIE